MRLLQVNTVHRAIVNTIFRHQVHLFRDHYRTEFVKSVRTLLVATWRYIKSIASMYWRSLQWSIRQPLQLIKETFSKEPPHSILELPLGAGYEVALTRAGVRTIPALALLEEDQVVKLCGKRGLKQIKAALQERGLDLGMDPSHLVLLFPRRNE